MITDVRFTAGSPVEHSTGLLGWVQFRLGGLIVAGVAVRRTLDGRKTLSFPVRTDAQGRRHSLVRPVNQAARQAIEAHILAEVAP